jgi:hypothetical protein
VIFIQIERDTVKIRSGATGRLKRAMNNGDHIDEEHFFLVKLPEAEAHCNHITGLVINAICYFFTFYFFYLLI